MDKQQTAKYLLSGKFTRDAFVIFLTLIHLLNATSCVTTPKTDSGTIPAKEVESKASNKISFRPIDEKGTFQKIEKFKRILQAKGQSLSEADWKLHDDLLRTYIRLKENPVLGTIVKVPARSQLKLDLPSFCLNSDRASPSDGERFRWVKQSPEIPYFREILKLVAERGVSSSDAQTLLWNLQNRTEWESYPAHLKAILQKVDPQAAFKLPSRLKSEAQDAAIDYSKRQIPFGQRVEDEIAFLKGRYYRYEDFANRVNSLSSAEAIEQSDDLVSMPDSPLVTSIQSHGFSSQEVTFHNPTDSPKEIDLAQYYLQPVRRDVQRIGLTGTKRPNDDLLRSLEEVLYGSMARLGIGFIPVIGDLADFYELLIGKDFLTGEILDGAGRILSGIGLIAGSGAGYRYALRAAHAPEKFIPHFEKGFRQVAKKEIHITNQTQLSAFLDEVRAGAVSRAGDSLDIRKYNPATEMGPLSKIAVGGQKVADTFRSSSYLEYKSIAPERIYRVQSSAYNEGKPMGQFWTRTQPAGPTQAALDSALDSKWGNRATHWIEAEIPAGTTIYEGTAAHQRGLVGGGNQIFIKKVEPGWITKQGKF